MLWGTEWKPLNSFLMILNANGYFFGELFREVVPHRMRLVYEVTNYVDFLVRPTDESFVRIIWITPKLFISTIWWANWWTFLSIWFFRWKNGHFGWLINHHFVQKGEVKFTPPNQLIDLKTENLISSWVSKKNLWQSWSLSKISVINSSKSTKTHPHQID